MKRSVSRGLAALSASLLSLSALGSCLSEAGDGEAGASTSTVAIEVAPLQLAGVGDATWRVAVDNGQGQQVWTRDVTSSQFGDGAGSIALVGPCDASPDANPNTVSVTLLQLVDTDQQPLVAGEDYVDPGSVSQLVTCQANADAQVTFNVTLARRAQQGFFDVAVSIRGVFCSAKLDCVDALLHQGDGERGPTVVLGFACTTGDLTPTWQYLSEVRLDCVDDADILAPLTQVLTPAAAQADGQQGSAPPLLFEWARYSVAEQLPDVDKCAWNHSFGLDLAAIGGRRCTLSATGTASDEQLVGGALPEGHVWPIITWEAEVVAPDGSLCENQPLDGDGSGVVTSYQLPTSDGHPPLSFAAEHTCAGAVSAALGYRCDADEGTVSRATRDQGAPAVAVTVSGVPAPELYRLPAGMTLVEECCAGVCCGP